jgi:hypothetical protein
MPEERVGKDLLLRDFILRNDIDDFRILGYSKPLLGAV